MHRFYYLLIVFLGSATLWASPVRERYKASDYIDLYQAEALKQMAEHKIPASVILGQAMVETDFGNSKLAVNANNHFGLKCHKEWKGPTYSYDDDKRNECFRKYESVLDSYNDHSMFLKSRPRYGFLFELEITDYRNWANGLKEAGYATHPDYAKKVIDIIEKYRLYELDRNGYIAPSPIIGEAMAKEEPATEREETTIAEKEVTHKIVKSEQGNFVIVKPGDTYSKIAREFNISYSAILKYNSCDGKGSLHEHDVVFIESKKEVPVPEYHTVVQGETAQSIANLYRLELKSFCKRNKLKLDGTVPKPGTVLYLSLQKPTKAKGKGA